MKDNIKIFFLLPTLSNGGGERVVSELSLNFPKNVEQTIVLFENKIFFPHKANIISLDTLMSSDFFQRFFRFFVRLYRFKKMVVKENPDWVISLGNSANLINILTNKNSVVRVDMFLSKEKNGFFSFLFKILAKLFFNRAKMIMPVSKASANDLIKNFGVKKEKILTMYNPIDVEKIQKSAKEPLALEHEKIFKNPVIITSGRLTKQKGQWHLIRAFSEVKKRVKNAKLVILGEGELELYYRELVRDYALENDVFFLGWQKNPFKFIAKSRLFVLPSLWEGLPMVVIEAMACGVPIVSTDCDSGPREILAPETNFIFQTSRIEYGKCGILAPTFDGKFYKASDPLVESEKIFADAIIETISNKKLEQVFSVASLNSAQNFDIKNIIKKWHFLFE